MVDVRAWRGLSRALSAPAAGGAVPPERKGPQGPAGLRAREPAAAVVPHREGEHAVETPGQCDRLEVLGQVGDHLGVARGLQLVAAVAELLLQPAVVVDLAVEGDANGVVLVGDWRITGDQVD